MRNLHPNGGSVLLKLARYGVPLAIGVAGVVLIVLGHGSTSSVLSQASGLAAVGVGLIIVAMIVAMLGWMFRMSVESNRDREREEAARAYFDEHGRWPDE